VDGLVHVSDLVWVQNFNMPDEAYNKNDDIEAVVLHVDPENERFSLGVKHLTEDPWEKIKKEYPEGIKADGEVVTINSAGAVIRLEDGIEGLVQEKEQVETLKEKDKVEVSVDKIMERERKFLLSLKKAN